MVGPGTGVAPFIGFLRSRCGRQQGLCTHSPPHPLCAWPPVHPCSPLRLSACVSILITGIHSLSLSPHPLPLLNVFPFPLTHTHTVMLLCLPSRFHTRCCVPPLLPPSLSRVTVACTLRSAGSYSDWRLLTHHVAARGSSSAAAMRLATSCSATTWRTLSPMERYPISTSPSLATRAQNSSAWLSALYVVVLWFGGCLRCNGPHPAKKAHLLARVARPNYRSTLPSISSFAFSRSLPLAHLSLLALFCLSGPPSAHLPAIVRPARDCSPCP